MGAVSCCRNARGVLDRGHGPGQIVTLALPPALLPQVNVELERSAWGVFRTECYPTYDFVPVRERIRERVRNGGQ